MSTAAAANVPAKPRSPRRLHAVPPAHHESSGDTAPRSVQVVPVAARGTSAPTRALRAVPPTREAQAAPRRRVRIEGATTEPLSVRGCSGESLGRESQIEPAPLRLTRRGRMVLTAVSVLVFGAAVLVLGLRVAGVLEPGPNFTHTVPVQVAPGESLWSIARSTNPGHDPAIVVEKIADLNNLSTPADITPGQTLQIPVAKQSAGGK